MRGLTRTARDCTVSEGAVWNRQRVVGPRTMRQYRLVLLEGAASRPPFKFKTLAVVPLYHWGGEACDRQAGSWREGRCTWGMVRPVLLALSEEKGCCTGIGARAE